MLHRAMGLGGLFWTTKEAQNECDILTMECYESIKAGLLKTVAGELAKYNSDLLGWGW